MNDGQNNNTGVDNNAGVTPITPITPITPQVNDGSANNNVQSSTESATNLTAVNIVNDSAKVGEKIDVVNSVPVTGFGGGSSVLMPSVSLPEVKGAEGSIAPVAPASDSSSSPGGTDTILPQLNLENASPFDIGVNAPINTNVSVPQGSVENVPVINNTQNTSVNNNDMKVNSNISEGSNSDIPSVGTYLLYMFLSAIPLIGLIILIAKALDKKSNMRNYAKAQLLLIIVFVALFVLFFVVAVLGSGLGSGDMYY